MSGDGGIDLSVGPLAGLVNALITAVLVPDGWSDPVSVIGISLAVGVLSGLLNGFMVAVVRVQPIIATLGTFLAYRGITLEMLPMAGGLGAGWLAGLAGEHGGVPGHAAASSSSSRSPGWCSSGPPFAATCSRSAATARAAYASGVNVVAVRILAYVIGGVLAAVAGLVFTAALGSGDPRVGVPYTLTSIAAVALGGSRAHRRARGHARRGGGGRVALPDADAFHARAGLDLLSADRLRVDPARRADAERDGERYRRRRMAALLG